MRLKTARKLVLCTQILQEYDITIKEWGNNAPSIKQKSRKGLPGTCNAGKQFSCSESKHAPSDPRRKEAHRRGVAGTPARKEQVQRVLLSREVYEHNARGVRA